MTEQARAWTTGRLVVVGVSYHDAPLEVRERLAFDVTQWRSMARCPVPEVLLVTCNRTEVYGWGGGRGVRTASQLARALARAADLPLETLRPYLHFKVGREALVHLVRVAAGLDSMVVGEDQIRGQVRDAHRLARQSRELPAPLDGVFQRALESTRRVRQDSALGQHPSVAAAAVHVAHRAPELQPTGLSGRMAIVLGAGAMAKSAVQALLDGGAQVTILNRTPIHAERLARELARAVSVAPLSALPRLLPGAAVLVGATAARQPVVDVATIQAAVAGRAGAPLIVLDVAVPRDVEPAVRSLPGVRLIDLDDLEHYCPADLATQRAEIQRAEALAAEEAQAIEEWLRVRAVSPAITELRRQADEIRSLELRRAAQRLRDLTPEQQAAVDQLTESIVNKLLHGPTVALREAATRRRGGARSREVVLGVFGVAGTRHGRRGRG